jgi:hypothetical protein
MTMDMALGHYRRKMIEAQKRKGKKKNGRRQEQVGAAWPLARRHTARTNPQRANGVLNAIAKQRPKRTVA